MEADKDVALKKWREKRRARQNAATAPNDDDDNLLAADVDDEPIITPAQKRRLEQEEVERLREKRARGGGAVEESTVGDGSNENTEATQQTAQDAEAPRGKGAPANADNTAAAGEKEEKEEEEPKKPNEGRVQSLLEQAAALNKNQNLTAEERAARQRQQEEELLLRHAQQVGGKALKNAKQQAQGIQYTQPMPSTWRVPRYILQQGEASWQKIRKDWHIDVEGSNIPPPLARFVDMKLPKPVIGCLQEKGITRPTPIQMQGIPIALAGRDVSFVA